MFEQRSDLELMGIFVKFLHNKGTNLELSFPQVCKGNLATKSTQFGGGIAIMKSLIYNKGWAFCRFLFLESFFDHDSNLSPQLPYTQCTCGFLVHVVQLISSNMSQDYQTLMPIDIG